MKLKIATLTAVLFCSACASTQTPAATTQAPKPDEVTIHMTQEGTCIERRGVEWKPLPVEQTEGKSIGDFIEIRNTLNGRISEQKNLMFDGRKWWDITGVAECVKK